ncbi:hypothetical protein NUSPORA_00918 [Nucleospora cyclopteri]
MDSKDSKNESFANNDSILTEIDDFLASCSNFSHLQASNDDCKIAINEFKIFGLTEIVGLPGVGKTKLICKCVENYCCIYITNGIVDFAVPENFLIKRINSFLELQSFILKKLETLIILCKNKNKEPDTFIVIDGLDRFLYTVEHPRFQASEITKIVQCLKFFIIKYKIKVIIINNFFNNSSWTERKLLYNKYLGYSWCYQPNIKFIIIKKTDNCEILNIKGEIIKKFKIINNQIEFINKF